MKSGKLTKYGKFDTLNKVWPGKYGKTQNVPNWILNTNLMEIRWIVDRTRGKLYYEPLGTYLKNWNLEIIAALFEISLEQWSSWIQAECELETNSK